MEHDGCLGHVEHEREGPGQSLQLHADAERRERRVVVKRHGRGRDALVFLDFGDDVRVGDKERCRGERGVQERAAVVAVVGVLRQQAARRGEPAGNRLGNHARAREHVEARVKVAGDVGARVGAQVAHPVSPKTTSRLVRKLVLLERATSTGACTVALAPRSGCAESALESALPKSATVPS